MGAPRWLSPAPFGSDCDPGVLGLSPTLESLLTWESDSAFPSPLLTLSHMDALINEIFKN